MKVAVMSYLKTLPTGYKRNPSEPFEPQFIIVCVNRQNRLPLL
jgi:hypothetical protein